MNITGLAQLVRILILYLNIQDLVYFIKKTNSENPGPLAHNQKGSMMNIERELASNKTVFFAQSGEKIRITIQCSGLGGRYQAFVKTPTYNTVISTPESVDVEGPLSFYSRLAPQLAEILQDV